MKISKEAKELLKERELISRGYQTAQEEIKEKIEKLKKSIILNGNLKYRIIETEDGEFKKVRDEILNNIVIEYIDEIFSEDLKCGKNI